MSAHLHLHDLWYVALVIMIVACGVAGLGEMRQWFSESRQLDHVRRLADLDNAARTPVSREQGSLGSLVQPPRPLDPDPALGCKFCGPPYDATADCGCASACKDPNCGWLQWLAAGEGWER